jgi:hypothetical protein
MAEENNPGTEALVTPEEKEAPVAATNPAPTALPDPATTETKAAPAADDWATLRTKLAGDDEKMLKRLSRYGTMQEAFKAGVEAQNKIGSLKSTNKPAEDATPEELTAYRAANGIPESPDKYEIALPNGMVVGDADQPLVDAFLKDAHAANIDPKTVNKFLATQLEIKEKFVQDRAEKDLQSLAEAREALSSPDVWGSEVKLNVNLISSFLDTAPKGVKELISNARGADGLPIANNVAVLQWLATTARELNPMATVVPGSGSNSAQVVEAELAKLTKMMGDQKSEYWKGPSSEKNQQRFRELVDAQQKWKAKQ